MMDIEIRLNACERLIKSQSKTIAKLYRHINRICECDDIKENYKFCPHCGGKIN